MKPLEYAQSWLDAFSEALKTGDVSVLDELFLEKSYWRDLLSLTWDTQQFWGLASFDDELLRCARRVSISNLQIDPLRTAPRIVGQAGFESLEFFFEFDTAAGRNKGFAILVHDGSAKLGFRARQLATQLVALTCAPEPQARHAMQGHDPAYPGQTWGEHLADKSSFRDRDPDVLIVGGGHSGLSAGARFERMGVSYLIVDKHKEAGDVWRTRYEALALHTHTAANDLPYISLPEHWGSYTPKDQWADWLKSYVKLMNLNYWSSTEFLGGIFNQTTGCWTVRLRLADGSIRSMMPKHIVMAVGGVGSQPRIPAFPGLKSFEGEVIHSTAYKSGTAYNGKNVMVVGTSTSGHDIALDLYRKGAKVTMLQRGAACVVNISEVDRLSADFLNGKMSKDEADQRRSANAILPLLIERTQALTVITEREHAELYAGLRKAGMKLTIGHDKTGWLMKLFRDLAGYYINVGCSDVIAAGGIKIVQSDEVVQFAPGGAQLTDGSVLPLDAIILATGFLNVSADIRELFGEEVAQKVGHIGGVGADGEPRNLCRPTGQAHLWMIVGGIIDARKSSPLLAFQIKAQMEGLVPSLVRQADGRVSAVTDAPGPNNIASLNDRVAAVEKVQPVGI